MRFPPARTTPSYSSESQAARGFWWGKGGTITTSPRAESGKTSFPNKWVFISTAAPVDPFALNEGQTPKPHCSERNKRKKPSDEAQIHFSNLQAQIHRHPSAGPLRSCASSAAGSVFKRENGGGAVFILHLFSPSLHTGTAEDLCPKRWRKKGRRKEGWKVWAAPNRTAGRGWACIAVASAQGADAGDLSCPAEARALLRGGDASFPVRETPLQPAPRPPSRRRGKAEGRACLRPLLLPSSAGAEAANVLAPETVPGTRVGVRASTTAGRLRLKDWQPPWTGLEGTPEAGHPSAALRGKRAEAPSAVDLWAFAWQKNPASSPSLLGLRGPLASPPPPDPGARSAPAGRRQGDARDVRPTAPPKRWGLNSPGLAAKAVRRPRIGTPPARPAPTRRFPGEAWHNGRPGGRTPARLYPSRWRPRSCLSWYACRAPSATRSSSSTPPPRS